MGRERKNGNWKVRLHIMKIKIRKGKKEDLEEISEIYREEYGKEPYNENWSRENALKMVKGQSEHSNILVAEVKGEIVGFIIFSDYPWEKSSRGHTQDFAVKSEFHGKGIGSKLLEEAEEELKEKGVKSIALSSHIESPAFGFYKKRGYKRNKMVDMEKDVK